MIKNLRLRYARIAIALIGGIACMLIQVSPCYCQQSQRGEKILHVYRLTWQDTKNKSIEMYLVTYGEANNPEDFVYFNIDGDGKLKENNGQNDPSNISNNLFKGFIEFINKHIKAEGNQKDWTVEDLANAIGEHNDCGQTCREKLINRLISESTSSLLGFIIQREKRFPSKIFAVPLKPESSKAGTIHTESVNLPPVEIKIEGIEKLLSPEVIKGVTGLFTLIKYFLIIVGIYFLFYIFNFLMIFYKDWKNKGAQDRSSNDQNTINNGDSPRDGIEQVKSFIHQKNQETNTTMTKAYNELMNALTNTLPVRLSENSARAIDKIMDRYQSSLILELGKILFKKTEKDFCTKVMPLVEYLNLEVQPDKDKMEDMIDKIFQSVKEKEGNYKDILTQYRELSNSSIQLATANDKLTKYEKAIEVLYTERGMELPKKGCRSNAEFIEREANELPKIPELIMSYRKSLLDTTQSINDVVKYFPGDNVIDQARRMLGLDNWLPTLTNITKTKFWAQNIAKWRILSSGSPEATSNLIIKQKVRDWVIENHWQYLTEMFRAAQLTRVYLLNIWPGEELIERLTVEFLHCDTVLRSFLKEIGVIPVSISFLKTKYTGDSDMEPERGESPFVKNNKEIQNYLMRQNPAFDVVIDVCQWGYTFSDQSERKPSNIFYFDKRRMGDTIQPDLS